MFENQSFVWLIIVGIKLGLRFVDARPLFVKINLRSNLFFFIDPN